MNKHSNIRKVIPISVAIYVILSIGIACTGLSAAVRC